MISFNEIAVDAKVANPRWNNKDVAMFHYFNPNGVLAKKRATDKLIDDAVDAGKARTGAIIAYGSMNHFAEDELYKLVNMKRVDRIKLKVTLEMLKRDIEAASKFLETV